MLRHCVICQEQDNVGRRVSHCVINRICKSAEARGDGVSFFRKQQENQSVLIQINCQRQVGNIMCKRKRAGDCVTEVVSKVSKVWTRKTVDSFNRKVDRSK